MKLQRTIDSRFLLQMTTLGLLVVLPVTMIVVNGSNALQAILMPASGQEKLATADALEGVPATSLRFGAYDPNGVFDGEKAFKLRHMYISWIAFDPEELRESLESLTQQGFEPLLTVEPWPTPEVDRQLLPAILKGDYDRMIDDVTATLRGLDGPIYISWGHEMDQDLTERYPWSGRDPEQFVKAYRYVVDRIRQQVDTELRWVWAGVLKKGSLRYWPGEQYADLVGMPIYSFPSWDKKTYGFIRDFRTTFEEKRKIVQGLNKPLMITEFGVSGSVDFEGFWLHQAFLSLDDYRDLVAIVFFYAKDTEGAWGSDVPTPDWRMHPDSIRSLVEWKLR